MSKISANNLNETTIEIYLANDSGKSSKDMVDFLAKKYDLMIGAPMTEENAREFIIEQSGYITYPGLPEPGELAPHLPQPRLREMTVKYVMEHKGNPDTRRVGWLSLGIAIGVLLSAATYLIAWSIGL